VRFNRNRRTLWSSLSFAFIWFISQPSIYIDGWLYGMRMTFVVCNVPVLSQNDSTYHHSVFTTWKWHPFATWTPSFIILVWGQNRICLPPELSLLLKRRSVNKFRHRYSMLWPLSVVLVANTNGRLAIPALAGLLVLSLWYYKVAATLFCAFFDCVLTGYRKLLCNALHCCSRCVVVLRQTSKLWTVTTLGHGCLVTVQWSELWHVNSLQSLCWEIGDKCRSWNHGLYGSTSCCISQWPK